MQYRALRHAVVHGRRQISERPPTAFLDELIAWGKDAPDEIFEPRGHNNAYLAVHAVLGPYTNKLHRRAVMLEVMRVLAGFESSWNWLEGVDTHPQRELKDAMTSETGAWQVSANSMRHPELRALVIARVGSDDPRKFQRAMKTDHRLAMEYIARLLRNTIAANGPVKRHEIDVNVRRDAVEELLDLLNPRGSDWTFRKGQYIVPFFPLDGKGP